MTREERLAQLLGETPDFMLEQALEPQVVPLPRFPWKRVAVIAACAAVALGIGVGLSAREGGTGPSPALDSSPGTAQTGITAAPVITPAPPLQEGYAISNELILTMLPMDGRIAEYHRVERPGESFSIRGPYGELEGWARPAEYEGLRYLIRQEEDGGYSLWEFACFQVWGDVDRAELEEAIASGESFWSGVEWFSPDMDVSPYPYAQVLEEIYGVTSAEDILSITLTPGNMDNTDPGKALQEEIGTRTLTDRAEISAVYEAIASMTCLGGDHWELIDLGGGGGPDLLDSVRVTRYLTIALADGSELTTLKYTAAGGQFYEYSGVAYAPLDEASAAEMSRIFGIS